MGLFNDAATYIYSKLRGGINEYLFDENGNWGLAGSNLEVAQDHPILTPALLFISKLFSQGEFKMVHNVSGKEKKEHWLIKLLENPNHYQTQTDFLESLMFMAVAQGEAAIYTKRVIGMDPNSMYVINPKFIKYPDGYKTTLSHRKALEKKDTTVIYDESGENIEIKLSDILFFYDMPNMLQKGNAYKVRSRLDGLKQTLENTADSLVAKNIILKTNGKELITTTGSGGFPLVADEKERVEKIYHNNYGLSKRRKRGIITKASLTWKSMHIALRDLGLDESIKVDGNIIYTALHIPKDILSLEAKKTTYNNYKESMVSFIQNEMQGSLKALTDVFQKIVDEPNLSIVGDYDHLPVMQFVLIEKYEVVIKRATALNNLLKTGIPKEVALELCGFDKTLVLTELLDLSSNGNSEGNNSNQQSEGEGNNEGDDD